MLLNYLTRDMNEEKVKNDIIVPFFKELGFDLADIEYETTFSINWEGKLTK